LSDRLGRLRRRRYSSRLWGMADLAGWLLGAAALLTIAGAGLAIGR
jgi:hypothetical protein